MLVGGGAERAVKPEPADSHAQRAAQDPLWLSIISPLVLEIWQFCWDVF